MATLTTRFSAKIFKKNQIDEALFLPRSPLRYPSDVCFSRSQNFSSKFNNSLSIQNRRIGSVSAFSLTFDPEVPTGSEIAECETQMQWTYPSKTMHVKFQLQKECMFGEQFFLVGDDPMLGLWDPSNAIPLNWSDGHIWTAEMDVPVGLAIQFKFILKARTEEIIWQPGPDRVFRAWENNNNTIIISEDWESADYQKLMEEEMAENPGFISNKEFITAGMNNEINNMASLEEDEHISQNDERILPKENIRNEEDEAKSMFGYGGGGNNVLVPGLAPSMAVVATQEAVPVEFTELVNNDMSIEADVATEE